MSDEDITNDGKTQHRSGNWLGELDGIRVRSPGVDANGPIIELHGNEDMAAVEVTTEQFVDEFSKMAAEVQMALDASDDTEP